MVNVVLPYTELPRKTISCSWVVIEIPEVVKTLEFHISNRNISFEEMQTLNYKQFQEFKCETSINYKINCISFILFLQNHANLPQSQRMN